MAGRACPGQRVRSEPVCVGQSEAERKALCAVSACAENMCQPAGRSWSAPSPWQRLLSGQPHAVLCRAVHSHHRTGAPCSCLTVRLRLAGTPIGYKLMMTASPLLMALPGSLLAKRAEFATQNLWARPRRCPGAAAQQGSLCISCHMAAPCSSNAQPGRVTVHSWAPLSAGSCITQQHSAHSRTQCPVHGSCCLSAGACSTPQRSQKATPHVLQPAPSTYQVLCGALPCTAQCMCAGDATRR